MKCHAGVNRRSIQARMEQSVTRPTSGGRGEGECTGAQGVGMRRSPVPMERVRLPWPQFLHRNRNIRISATEPIAEGHLSMDVSSEIARLAGIVLDVSNAAIERVSRDLSEPQVEKRLAEEGSRLGEAAAELAAWAGREAVQEYVPETLNLGGAVNSRQFISKR